MMDPDIGRRIVALLLLVFVVSASLGVLRRFSPTARATLWCVSAAAFGGIFSLFFYSQMAPVADSYSSAIGWIIINGFSKKSSWLTYINHYGEIGGVVTTGMAFGAAIGWFVLRTKVWKFDQAEVEKTSVLKG